MKLVELKIACYIYNQITEYDDSYCVLQEKYNELDLAERKHIIDLLKWLRKWGCRQFKIVDENISINSIINWYELNKFNIPDFNKSILEFDFNENKVLIIELFDDLSNRIASKRNKNTEVHISAVGAGKILFALRPNLFAPWDNFIFDGLKLRGQGSCYYQYLIGIQLELRKLKKEMETKSIKWDNLFSLLDKKHNSFPKLIDEYYWVRFTNKIDPSDIIKFCSDFK